MHWHVGLAGSLEQTYEVTVPPLAIALVSANIRYCTACGPHCACASRRTCRADPARLPSGPGHAKHGLRQVRRQELEQLLELTSGSMQASPSRSQTSATVPRSGSTWTITISLGQPQRLDVQRRYEPAGGHDVPVVPHQDGV